jgi:hypothetical protein
MEAGQLSILLEKSIKPEKGRAKRKVQLLTTKLEISWSKRPKFKKKSRNFVEQFLLIISLAHGITKPIIRMPLFFFRVYGSQLRPILRKLNSL